MNATVIQKDKYDKLFSELDLSFMQSSDWGEVKSKDWDALLLEVNNFPILVLTRNIPSTSKSFAYIPRLFSKDLFDSEIIENVINYLREKGDIVHLQIDFEVTESSKLKLLKEIGFDSTGEQLQPQFTNIIDLSVGEEELLKSFDSKTRNKINKPTKLGAKSEVFYEGNEALDRSYQIINSVTKLTDYVAQDKQYFENVWNIFGKKKQAKIIITSVDGKDYGTYFSIIDDDNHWELYGGMNEIGREMRGAGYFLKWESIKDAINSGIKYYDQWGVAPLLDDETFDRDHRFFHIGNFKKEFMGEYVEYLPQQTLVYDKSGYQLFKLGKFAQKGNVRIKKLLG